MNLNQDSMDTFVFCVATKKTAQRLVKDETDLVSNNRLLMATVLTAFSIEYILCGKETDGQVWYQFGQVCDHERNR